MAHKEWSFLGAGVPFIGEYDNTGLLKDGIKEALSDHGNVTQLNLTIETEEKSVPNKRTCGGGKINSLTRVVAMTGTVQFTDFTPENLAKAFFGSHEDVAAGAVTDEEHASWGLGLIPFDFLPDESVDYVVTDDAGTTTYTKDVDYVQTHAGIEVISVANMPTDGSTIKVDYTKAASELVKALMDSSKKYRLYLQGLNEMQSCAPFDVDLFKVSFGATEGLDIITEDPGVITIPFEVLMDATKGTGESAYFNMRKVKDA